MRRFGLIGRPLGHSASAAYFTEKFSREGITDCEYSLYELGSIGDLPGLLERLPELCGLNVTIPYKRDVMAFLDSVSPEAEAIGAVNCIRRTADGRLAGHNTDVIGLRAALNELLGAAQPGQALVLGTGGASQAVQYALAERDIPFALVSREAAKGNYTYDDLPCEAVEASRLIVNASPVGTYPNVDARAAYPLCLCHAGALPARPGLQSAADAVPRLRPSARGAYSERADNVRRAGRSLVAHLECLKRNFK